MFERIKRMVIKEFIQILRDKRMKAVVFVVPVVQLIVFGYAVTTDVNNVRTVVYDPDKSFESRELVRRMESSGYFEVVRRVERPDEIGPLLDSGDALVAVSFDERFSRDLRKGVPTSVQLLFDGSDSNTAMVAMNYAGTIVARYAREMGGKKIGVISPNIDYRVRAWYNPDLRSKNYNVPGVIAIMIMLICLLLTAMAVVRERESGTMEQLMVTPLRPVELILGKTIPFAIIGFFDMVIVTIAGVFWFSIPIAGSFGLLALCTVIYLFSILGSGLFISTVSKTQQQALMASFLFFMPAILLSGLMFPIENMPVIIQYSTYLNPLRYFLIIIRGIFLKGDGIAILWPQIASLLVLGLLVLGLSVTRFKKKLG